MLQISEISISKAGIESATVAEEKKMDWRGRSRHTYRGGVPPIVLLNVYEPSSGE